MSPQQQIYDEVFKVCLNLGYDTYNYLPAEEVSYPFVYVGEQFDQDRLTKSAVYGDVQQTIHIYEDYRNRFNATSMMNSIKREIRKLKHTKKFYIRVKGITGQTLPENTESRSLVHGVLEVDFTFN